MQSRALITFTTLALALALLASPASAAADGPDSDRSEALARSAAAAGLPAAKRITLIPPRRRTVEAGRSLTVRGRVASDAPKAGRPVDVQLKTPSGWMTLASGKTNRRGRYRVDIPTDWYFAGAVRAAVGGAGSPAVVSKRAPRVRVKPDYRTRGSARAWTGDPGPWSPCQVIRYRVNPTGGPERALAQAKRAVRHLAAATGYRFVFEGRSKRVAYGANRGWLPHGDDVELLISWTTPARVPALLGSVVGYGGWASGWDDGASILRGAVALDRTASLRNGFGRGATWGSLLLHELGHVFGLGHSNGLRTGESQVMWAGLGGHSPGRYQAGDLAGLRHVGAARGCEDDDGLLARAAVPGPVWFASP